MNTPNVDQKQDRPQVSKPSSFHSSLQFRAAFYIRVGWGQLELSVRVPVTQAPPFLAGTSLAVHVKDLRLQCA